jgi:hypothetical protein
VNHDKYICISESCKTATSGPGAYCGYHQSERAEVAESERNELAARIKIVTAQRDAANAAIMAMAKIIMDSEPARYAKYDSEKVGVERIPESPETVIEKLRKALMTIAYEPIGALDAGYKEVAEGMEAIAREALR